MDIHPKIIKELNEIKKKAIVPEVRRRLDDLLIFISDDRSMVEHRLREKFLNYVWETVNEEYDSKEDFRSHIKRLIGYCKVSHKDYVDDSGNRIKIIRYLPYSFRFAKCGQKKHHDLFEKIKEVVMRKWQINFAEWFTEFGG